MNSTEILRIFGINVEENEVAEIPRAKKRRLDHLSWDEKIQRKKLKNRVAAQTSRDRKKARIEQMENAITELCNRNDALLAECESLKSSNEQLSQENEELRARLMGPCLSCKQKRSVGPASDEESSDGIKHKSSSGFVQNTDSLENSSSIPSLPDLLDELDSDYDLESLEQLTETLLKDIARDLENAAQETDCQIPKHDKSERQRGLEPMVGKTSEKLESTTSTLLNTEKSKSLENDISQYLLLHHNYTKPGPDPKDLIKTTTKSRKQSKSVTHTNKKLKKIIPKIPVNLVNTGVVPIKTNPIQTIVKCEPLMECSPIVKSEQDLDNADIIYGTYDEATNCVTIVINEDGTSATESDHVVLTPENTVSQNFVKSYTTCLDLPYSKIVNGSVSPMSCSGSDGGYESLDSPGHGENDWHEMSELFPTLL